MPIGPTILTEHGVFEPEAVVLMGEAFDAACGELASSGQSEEVRELVALLIIVAALRGEIDPLRLREIVLSELAPPVDMPRSAPCVGEREPAALRQSGRPRSIEDEPTNLNFACSLTAQSGGPPFSTVATPTAPHRIDLQTSAQPRRS
jgi:hypothetical protein